MPRWARLGWLALVGANLFAASAANAQSFGCLDEAELVSWKQALTPRQQRLLTSPRELYGASLAQFERQLAQVEQPDAAYARRYVATSWTVCQMGLGNLSEAKLQRALKYHETGDLADSRFNASNLGLFHGMGWGVPRDTERATALFMRRQQLDSLDDFAAEHGFANAPPDAVHKAFLFHTLADTVLPARLHQHWQEMVRGRPEQVHLVASIALCPVAPQVEPESDRVINPVIATAALSSLLELLPTEGLPCTRDDGSPSRMRFEFDLYRPDPSPFDRP